MRRRLQRCVWSETLLAAGLVSLCLGCGKSSAPKIDPTKQATISGSVNVSGKPLPADCVIYFTSDETGTTATGKVDALGNFTAKPPDPAKGLVAGRYKVIVKPPGKGAIQVTDPSYNKLMQQPGGMKPQRPAADESSGIPKAFQALDTTKLVLEVQPGANKFDIDLTKIK